MGDTLENKLNKHICLGIVTHVDAGQRASVEEVSKIRIKQEKQAILNLSDTV